MASEVTNFENIDDESHNLFDSHASPSQMVELGHNNVNERQTDEDIDNMLTDIFNDKTNHCIDDKEESNLLTDRCPDDPKVDHLYQNFIQHSMI